MVGQHTVQYVRACGYTSHILRDVLSDRAVFHTADLILVAEGAGKTLRR